VFAPCALEYSINEKTLPRLKAKVICGTANNQMSHAVGVEAHKRGILYAPDYAVNAGGSMNVSLEIDGYNRERAMRLMRNIYHTVGRIFDLSEQENIAPQYAADRIAEARIAAIGKLKLPLGRTAPRFMGHLRGER
jgi:leucine dehydrogenase